MTRKSDERRQTIFAYVKGQGTAGIQELAELCHVSDETIRKDLEILAHQGRIEKKHGIAKLIENYNHVPLMIKREDHLEDKIAIASQAATLIKDNQFIWLDAGSSAYTLLRFLNQKKHLTIATNSIEIAAAIANGPHKLLVVGGELEPIGQSLVGPFANEQVNSLHFDIAFLGSDGFKDGNGPTTFAYEEMQIKRTALIKSNMSVLLVDDSKLFECAPYCYARFTELDRIVTTIDPSVFPEPEKVIRALPR